MYDLYTGDALSVLSGLPSESVQTCVTSPPYWGLRDYGVEGQIGLEQTPDEYVTDLVTVFREVRRVLREDGTLWLNLGDSYASNVKGQNNNGEGASTLTTGARLHVREAYNDGRGRQGRRVEHGLKEKDLVGIPWRVAFALQADSWYLRSDIIWHKPNAMPESVRDRPTKAHEYLFLLSKSPRYYYDHLAIQEPAISPERAREKGNGESAVDTKLRGFGSHCGTYSGRRNKRSVWTVATRPYKGAHFATFPPALIEPCILAGSRAGDLVLDPFNGAGTTGLVALQHGRRYAGIELNPEYVSLTETRLAAVQPALYAAQVAD